MEQKREITSVFGAEPNREGEYPSALMVGQHTTDARMPKVAKIATHEQNLGTYGILWYIAYDEHGDEVGRLNAVHVAQVCVAPTAEEVANYGSGNT